MKSRTLLLAGGLVCISLLSARGLGEGFSPDRDGWIRHWIVYGPIGFFPEERGQLSIPYRHPVTFELLLILDFIAEAEGKEARKTEKNFLPEPGKEIDTEFGAVLPDHVLRGEAGEALNPNGKLVGIAWSDCDCTVNFDQVFNFPSVANRFDSPSVDALYGDAGPADVANYLAYAYTYVENMTGRDLEVFPSLADDDNAAVLLGRVPEPEKAGADFMEYVFLHDDASGGAGGSCSEEHGPERENPHLTPRVNLGPGLNLLLVKVLERVVFHEFRFRFRHADAEAGYPPVTEGIRIRLSPDPEAPDPPLFKRMDANGDGAVDISDAVAGLLFLFGGENTLRCPDAADADDDGELSVNDAVYILTLLFREASPAHRPLFPYPCCGLDPTSDALDRFAAGGVCEYPATVCQ
jgi:hypothetical protein